MNGPVTDMGGGLRDSTAPIETNTSKKAFPPLSVMGKGEEQCSWSSMEQ